MSEIAPGKYRGRAVSWGLGEASTGSEQVAIEFVVMDVEGVEGPHITWYGYFTDAAFPHTMKALRTCGWQGDQLTDLTGLDANDVQLVIENETGQDGRVYPKVRWVNPAHAGGLALKAPLSGDKAKVFAAKMRSRIAAFDQSEGLGGGKSKTARPSSRAGGVLSPEPPPHDESDIPF